MKRLTQLSLLFLIISLVSIGSSIAQPQGEVSPIKPQNETQNLVEQTGFSKGRVARSAFTTDVIDREPADDLTTITNNTASVKFFTDLRDMSGHTVIHRWEYQGKVISEVTYDVKGPRWRVWSSKNMLPHWLGKWTVSVVNTVGEVIETREFDYVEPGNPQGAG